MERAIEGHMQTARADGTFQGVQALRFFAALLVVVAHATQMAHDKIGVGQGTWENGTAGVDVFFVISGFVMSLTAAPLALRQDGWSEFLRRRIVRVMPMYWIATTLRVIMVLAIPAMALRAAISADHLVASYLLVPWPNQDGLVFPFLTVGWTLTFEMFFYLLVALALFLRKPPLAFCAVIFVVVAAAGVFLAVPPSVPSQLPPALVGAKALLNPIVLEFIFGMAIARFAIEPVLRAWQAAGLLTAALVVLLTVPALGAWRPFTWGVPAAVIVAVTVQLESRIRNHMPAPLLFGGDASYALYLFHPFVIAAAGIVLARLHIRNEAVIVSACMIGATVTAAAIHLAVEKPLTALLRPKRRPELATGTV